MTEPYPPSDTPAFTPKPEPKLPSWGSVQQLGRYAAILAAVLVLGGGIGYSVWNKGLPKLVIPMANGPKAGLSLDDLLTEHRNLARMWSYSTDEAQRKGIRKQIDVVVAKIRTMIDTMPDDQVPAEARRFKVVR